MLFSTSFGLVAAISWRLIGGWAVLDELAVVDIFVAVIFCFEYPMLVSSFLLIGLGRLIIAWLLTGTTMSAAVTGATSETLLPLRWASIWFETGSDTLTQGAESKPLCAVYRN